MPAQRSEFSMTSSITPTPYKTALITGITGQDGSYLAELLLEKGYEVHGIKRRASSFNTSRIDHLYQDPHEDDPRLVLHYGDLTDSSNLIRIIQQVQPDEIYNLGAQSHVAVSFEAPEYTANRDALCNDWIEIDKAELAPFHFHCVKMVLRIRATLIFPIFTFLECRSSIIF